MSEPIIPRPCGLQPQAPCTLQGPLACFTKCIFFCCPANRRDSQEPCGACLGPKISNLGSARCRTGPAFHDLNQCLHFSGTDNYAVLACLCDFRCRYGSAFVVLCMYTFSLWRRCPGAGLVQLHICRQHSCCDPAGEQLLLQDVCLLLGSSLGYLQLHAEDGQLLHRQRLHTTSAQTISARVSGMGKTVAMHGCCACGHVLDSSIIGFT